MARATFYYDPTSPYVWMAAERIGDLIPDADWQPIYAFGLFKLNGRTPWVLTDEREPRMREIEQRAKRYGLPPVRWPRALPERRIAVIRGALVAKEHGREREFVLAALREMYTRGGDPSHPDELRRICEEAGLDPDAILARVEDQDVKDAIRDATAAAHERGVIGVPVVAVGDELFWGDDRLDEAADAARGAAASA